MLAAGAALVGVGILGDRARRARGAPLPAAERRVLGPGGGPLFDVRASPVGMHEGVEVAAYSRVTGERLPGTARAVAADDPATLTASAEWRGVLEGLTADWDASQRLVAAEEAAVRDGRRADAGDARLALGGLLRILNRRR